MIKRYFNELSDFCRLLELIRTSCQPIQLKWSISGSLLAPSSKISFGLCPASPKDCIHVFVAIEVVDDKEPGIHSVLELCTDPGEEPLRLKDFREKKVPILPILLKLTGQVLTNLCVKISTSAELLFTSLPGEGDRGHQE